MWNGSDLCKSGEEYSQFSCECWKRHSYSFLRQPLAVIMSVQEYMVVPLKLAFLDIKCEENSACDCPTKLEDWWQSSAERNFASHCWQELPTTESNFLFVRHFFFEHNYSCFLQQFLATYRWDATLLFVRKARFLDPVGLEVACGKLAHFRSTLFPFATCYGEGDSNKQRRKSNLKALIDMPCVDSPVSDMQSWSDCQPIYIVVFGSTSPKPLFWLNNACADGRWLSEALKTYNVILVFRDCFVQYVAV